MELSGLVAMADASSRGNLERHNIATVSFNTSSITRKLHYDAPEHLRIKGGWPVTRPLPTEYVIVTGDRIGTLSLATTSNTHAPATRNLCCARSHPARAGIHPQDSVTTPGEEIPGTRSFYFGHLVDRPEALSGVWEAPDGQGGAVAQKTSEIGLRIAIGADTPGVFRLVFSREGNSSLQDLALGSHSH